MSRSEDIKSLQIDDIVLGTNTFTAIPAVSGQVGFVLKMLSGGTLAIGYTGSTFGISCYPLAATEVVSMDCSGTFYLFATGATCTASLMRGKTAGT